MMENADTLGERSALRTRRARLKARLDRRGLRWLRTSLMVVSLALAGPSATPDAEIQVVLDRFGLRWILRRLLERSAELRARGVTGVVHRRGAWFHRFDETHVHAETPGARCASPDELDGQTRDTWEHHYTPVPGDTVVDIGAGTGTEVLRWSRSVGAAGRVIAVEAHPRTFGVMQTLCELNGLTNVSLLNVAVSDSSGTIEIETLAEHEAASIVTGQGTVPVRCVTVDQLLDLAGLDTVDFLKMNIEGAELPALQAMRTGAERIRRLCVSCHDFRAEWGHGEVFRTRDGVIHALREMGFSVGRRHDERPWIRDQVFARRPGLGV